MRGKAVGDDAPLTPRVAECLGIAFARFLAEKKHKSVTQISVGLGRDSRISGPALAEEVARGVSKAGASVQNYGMCTTPAMFMAVITPGFEPDGSVMITASRPCRRAPSTCW